MEISHRSSPSKLTTSDSSPIGPIDAFATVKRSGSDDEAVALPGVSTTGWSQVAPPNCAGSATRRPKREERQSPESSGAPPRPVILRPLSFAPAPSLKSDRWAPSSRRHSKKPVNRFTVVLLEEDLKGSVRYDHFKAPGKRFHGKVTLVRAALA